MTLEITDHEYLIKLDRKKFGLAFIRSLLKQVEVANPTEEVLNVKDRGLASSSTEPDYFGSLDEK